MSIKSFKTFVTEKTDYTTNVAKGSPAEHKGGKKHAAGETAAVKQGSTKMNENNIAADYVAPKDSDEEATTYKPRSKGEEDFKSMHTMKHTKHPVAGDHQFDGSRGEIRK